MTECRLLSKEPKEGRQSEPELDEPSDYYYDDATGYRIYKRDRLDDDDDDDEDDR